MALTDAQHQLIILATVGDDDQGTVATILPILWEEQADQTDPRQRRLRVQLAAIGVLLGSVRGRVSWRSADGTQVSEKELTENLHRLREATMSDLAQATQDAGSSYAAGVITQTTPIAPPTGYPVDASDAAYRGDPYRPPMRGTTE